ncbi:MAG TPA: sodium/solute symporter [Spirochaetia bacterium]|nr:sodium/solute symporter [Spirochaetia bacterium]
MMVESWFTIVLIVYLGFTLVIGYLARRQIKSAGDYWIAGGKLGWLVGGATIAATQMSSGLFIGTIGLTYNVGWTFFWVVFCFPLAYWGLAWLVAPKFKRFGKFTLPDFIGARYYGHVPRTVASILIIPCFLVYIVAQLKAGGMILNLVYGVPEITGAVIFFIIIIAYTAIGGLIAVAYTDFIQMIIMLGGALVAVPLVLRNLGGISETFRIATLIRPGLTDWGGIPPLMLVGLFFAFFIGSFGRPEVLTRFYAMKDEKTIRKGILWVIILVFAAHFLCFILAMAIRALTPNLPSADVAMPALASFFLPGVLGSLLLAAIIAAMMSTVDSVLLVASSAFAHDIYSQVINPNATEKTKLRIAAAATILVGVLALLMYIGGFGQMTLIQLIVALFSALVGSTFTSVVLLGCLWKRTTKLGAVCGMIGGFAVTWIWHFANSPMGLNPVIPGVIVSALLTVLLSLATPAPPKEALAPFFKSERAEG